jgi:hypothetical protein
MEDRDKSSSNDARKGRDISSNPRDKTRNQKRREKKARERKERIEKEAEHVYNTQIFLAENGKELRICWKEAQTGNCKYGNKCRFTHTGKRLTKKELDELKEAVKRGREKKKAEKAAANAIKVKNSSAPTGSSIQNVNIASTTLNGTETVSDTLVLSLQKLKSAGKLDDEVMLRMAKAALGE